MPGRPSKPFALHVAQGTDRSRVKTREASKAHLDPGDIGPPPEWFSPEMKTEWKRVKAELPYLRAADRTTVMHHCILNDRCIQDARGERGMTASERNCFHSVQMQLGRTPASQSKVTATNQNAASDDEWDF